MKCSCASLMTYYYFYIATAILLVSFAADFGNSLIIPIPSLSGFTTLIPHKLKKTPSRLLLINHEYHNTRVSNNVLHLLASPLTDNDTDNDEYNDFDEATSSSPSSSSSSPSPSPSLASPQSTFQVDSANQDYLRPLKGQKMWLENATESVLDLDRTPLGSLSEDDIQAIVGVMAAWVRRKSMVAAMNVEALLKRIIDDMRAGNKEIKVTTRMYTIVIDAWAKSGVPEGAERAQTIHDTLVNLYKESGDFSIAPSIISYNTLLNAWKNSGTNESTRCVEKIFREMLDSGEQRLKPDAFTFSALLETYARSNDPNSIHRSEELFQIMNDLGVKRNLFTFSALQNVYARSGRKDATERVLGILNNMLDLYEKGDIYAKPSRANYNNVLAAYAATKTKKAAVAAYEMLKKIEQPVSMGGYDVEPDRNTYELAILACRRCPAVLDGVNMAEEILERLEARAKVEAQKRLEVSSAAPPAVFLDVVCFNHVLTAMSKYPGDGFVQRIINILKRMEKYADAGDEKIRPNIRSWNALLSALSYSKEPSLSSRAEQTLNHMNELYKAGKLDMKPNSFSYAAVLSSYQRSSDVQSLFRADELVETMLKLFEKGELTEPPNVYHYTIVCLGWAKQNHKDGPKRCVEILSLMKKLDNAGYSNSRPDMRTYSAVIDCLSKAGEGEKTEQLIFHILDLCKRGDRNACPDSFLFYRAIDGLVDSGKRDNIQRAEALLDVFLDFEEENPHVNLDPRVFLALIGYYSRSKEVGAPYRAEYLLNRMVALFKAGKRALCPNNFAFCKVMDAYSYSKHPDSGERGEQLLRMATELKQLPGSHAIQINVRFKNSLILAWLSSGDPDAGRRAEIHLQDMEQKSAAGHIHLLPDDRSFGLALNAWCKSPAFDKAERAFDILNRMEKHYNNGNFKARPSTHACALVINACAFTDSNEEAQETAFRIACTVMDKMLDSAHTAPDSLAYGWFFQACSRLTVSPLLKEEYLEKVFRSCCENGYVDDFTFERFRGAASPALFKKLVFPVLSDHVISNASPDIIKDQLSYRCLPESWREKPSKRMKSKRIKPTGLMLKKLEEERKNNGKE